MAFTQITVTRNYASPDGSPATGTVVFQLSSGMVDTSTGNVAVPTPVTATIGATSPGLVSQVLDATNDTTTTPTGVTYKVTENVFGMTPNVYYVVIPYNASGGTVDLSTLTSFPNPPVVTGQAGGDLTGTYPDPSLAATANVESIIRAQTLNQMGAPTAALGMNAQRLTDLATPQAATDAAQALGTMLGEVILFGSGFGANISTPADQTWAVVPDTDLVNSAGATTPATLVFTPISDQVDLLLQFGSTGTGSAGVALDVATSGTTTPLGAPPLLGTNAAVPSTLAGLIRIAGLTPGTAVSWDLIFCVSTGTTAATLNVSANATSAGAGGSALIMRATAR